MLTLLALLFACQGVPSMQTAPAASPVPGPPPGLPHVTYTITSRDDWLTVSNAMEAAGTVPAVVDVTLPAGDVTWFNDFYRIPAIHLILRGVGPATVVHDAIDIREVASVEVRDLRFAGHGRHGPDPLTITATQSITLHNLAFLDQVGTNVTTSHGVIPTDHVAKLEVAKGGTIALTDVTLLGARGAWPAIRMVAPGGAVSITRTLVADTERPPFYVGIAHALSIEDSVLVAPPGVSLFATQWPPGNVTLRRSTLVADTPALVHPGHNPQAPSSRWMPALLADSTLYVRTAAAGHGPGVTAEGAAIRPAPDAAVDLPALRARAEGLAPVDRAALAPLLGLAEP